MKRGYVSHAQADVPSMHKLLADLFAIPYPNKAVEHAALLVDLFHADAGLHSVYIYSP